MSESIVLGVDLGGTKIEAVVLRLRADGAFDELDRERTDTLAAEGYDRVLEQCSSLIARVESRHSKSALRVGVAMPGGVRRSDGTVKNSNATCLNGRPFRQDLCSRLQRSIAFDNDANCFALAETLLGAGRAHRDGLVFGVIMGTGVGGGLVAHGRIWSGVHGIAGEWGHHPVHEGPEAIECYCGHRGCLERYASGPALEAHYLRLAGLSKSPREVIAARATDPHAERAVQSMLWAFGRGLATLVDVLDPSCIVLGGGLSNSDCLCSEGVAIARSLVFNDEWLTPVVRHELGDSAGVFGAAMLAAQRQSAER
ncbi:MAG: ROK family protein [Polyangiales bacterium]